MEADSRFHFIKEVFGPFPHSNDSFQHGKVSAILIFCTLWTHESISHRRWAGKRMLVYEKMYMLDLKFSRRWVWRMPSSRMLRRVALVRTDVSEERSAFLRSLCRLLVTTNGVRSSPILVTLTKEALSSSQTLVLTRATRHNTLKDAILHSHRRENLKSCRV
jgi:hypothetical protein